jgi:hypothetical protein
MPAKFTYYYVFEFYEGKVRVQPLVTSDESEAFVHVLTENPKETARAINEELFGSPTLEGVELSQVKLPKTEECPLKAKKIKSLQNKYHSIPPDFLPYYPNPEDYSDLPLDEPLDSTAEQPPPHKKRRQAKAIPGTKELGRPKKGAIVDSSQPSILRFLKKKV